MPLNNNKKMNGLKLKNNKNKPQNIQPPPDQFENQFLEHVPSPEKLSQKQEEKELSQSQQESSNSDSDSSDSDSDSSSSSSESSSQEKQGGKQKEKKKIKKIDKGLQLLKLSILRMKQNYNNLDMDEVLFRKRSPTKQAQIKQFLRKKRQEKKKLRKKMRKLKLKEEKKRNNKFSISDEAKRNIPKERVEEALDKMKKNKEKRQQERKKQQIKDKSIQDMYEKMNSKDGNLKRFHLQKEKEDKKKKIRRREEQKQFLEKRRRNYKPIDYQALDDHAKRHDELVKQLQAVKRAEKQQKYREVIENNEKLQQFYRGRSYQYIQSQLMSQKLKRKQPKQKNDKMKNYQEYIREHFLPRSQQQNKSFQLENQRDSLTHRRIKRYRFLQGQSLGQIVQNKPLPKTQAQQRKIGNDNMAYMISLPKKRRSEANLEEDSLLQQKRVHSMPKIQKLKAPIADRNWGVKNLNVKISDKPTRQQMNMMINRLKNKDKQAVMKEKVMKSENNRHRSKEVNESIIDNIERKLSLLSKL